MTKSLVHDLLTPCTWGRPRGSKHVSDTVLYILSDRQETVLYLLLDRHQKIHGKGACPGKVSSYLLHVVSVPTAWGGAVLSILDTNILADKSRSASH